LEAFHSNLSRDCPVEVAGRRGGAGQIRQKCESVRKRNRKKALKGTGVRCLEQATSMSLSTLSGIPFPTRSPSFRQEDRERKPKLNSTQQALGAQRRQKRKLSATHTM
jgi:hypothetical protein